MMQSELDQSKFKISRFCVLIIAILFLFSCAAIQNKPVKPVLKVIPESKGYTYDGEFDPVVFFKWDIHHRARCANGHVHYFLTNPDKDHPVKMVETINIDAGFGKMTIVAYRYMKNYIWYIFSLDIDKGHYEQLAPSSIDKSKGI